MTSYLDSSGYQEDPHSVSHRAKTIAITLVLVVSTCALLMVAYAGWSYHEAVKERREQERIVRGMTAQQVDDLLGPPSQTLKAPLFVLYLPNQTERIASSPVIETSKIAYCEIYTSAHSRDLIIYFDSADVVLGSGRATYMDWSRVTLWY
jgi:hypothetical protein